MVGTMGIVKNFPYHFFRLWLTRFNWYVIKNRTLHTIKFFMVHEYVIYYIVYAPKRRNVQCLYEVIIYNNQSFYYL